jgi:uncharacterized protein YkwD
MRVRTIRGAAICLAVVVLACEDDDGAEDRKELGEPAVAEYLQPAEAIGEGETVSDWSSAVTGSPDGLLCKSCNSNADCGGGSNYCLQRSDGVRFCGRDCRTMACPSSYTCMRLSTTVQQCVPPAADCSRVPTAPVDAGVPDAGTRVDSGTPSVDAGTSVDAGMSMEVPNTPHCAAAAAWNVQWSGYENEVLRLSNEYRRTGATCGTTPYAPAPALTMSPALRCAARLHSKDMIDRAYFSHTTPDGVTFSQRITQAGYSWRTAGENIASGYRTPREVVDGWIKSPGHCQNLMKSAFTQIGIGFYQGNSWTQDFGTPW